MDGGRRTAKARGWRWGVVALLMAGSLLAIPRGAAAQAEPEAGSPDPEIIDGTPVTGPGQFPFQVAILNRSQPNNFQAQFCGGTLIGPRRVLTAAHCVISNGSQIDAGSIDVLVGTHRLDNGSGRRIHVTQIHVHRGYNPNTLKNDLATLDLAQRADTNGVRTVSYARPNQASLASGTAPVTVIGWGQVNPGTPPAYTAVLQRANIEIVPRSICRTWYGGVTGHPPYNHQIEVCAGIPNRGACHGDSGGPLLRRRNNKWIQVGIVSHGEPAAAGGCATRPEVYSRVSAFSLGNDQFGNAVQIPSRGGQRTVKTFLATKQVGEPNHAGNVGGASAWFRWRAPRNGFVTISTAGSNYDTLLGVYRGPALNRLTRVAGNDDVQLGTLTSQVRFRARAGVTYRIAVDGWRGDFGSARVRVRLG